MPFYYQRYNATARVLLHLKKSFYKNTKTPKLAKVKEHLRIRNGRTVKVRSYFRRLRDQR